MVCYVVLYELHGSIAHWSAELRLSGLYHDVSIAINVEKAGGHVFGLQNAVTPRAAPVASNKADGRRKCTESVEILRTKIPDTSHLRFAARRQRRAASSVALTCRTT